MRHRLRHPRRRWFAAALLLAVPILAACTVNNSPDGWARPLATELDDGTPVILARTSDDRLGALDIEGSRVVWEFPGAPSGQLVDDAQAFPGLADTVDVQGFYGVPVAIGPNAEEFVIADYNEGMVFAIQRDGSSARILLETNDRVIAGVIADTDARTLYIATTDEHVYAIDTDNPPTDLNDLDRFIWIVDDLDGKVWGTPAIAQTQTQGPILIVPTTNGEVLALRTADGSRAWQFKSEAAVASDIVVADGLAFFGGFDRSFYALDVESGAVRWTQRGSNWFWSRALVSDGALYVGDLDGNLWAWDAANGAPLWPEPYQLDERIRAQPVLTAEGELFVATREGHLVALDPASGLKIWASRDAAGLKVPNRVLATPLAQADGRILLSDDQGKLWESRVGIDSICPVFPRQVGDCQIQPPDGAG